MARIGISEWEEPDKILLLEAWARDGLTDEQIAGNMGINVRTVYNWKKKSEPILQALKKGKEVADIEVENALRKRALGYKTTEVVRERLVDTGQKKRHGGESELTEKEWQSAIMYFNKRCCYCGKPLDDPTKDHIEPISKGGRMVRENILPCCRECNSSKKDLDMLSWYQKQSFYSAARMQRIRDYIDAVLLLGDTDGIGELVVTKEVTREVPPDVTAQIFWLKNRKPEQWRDKREQKIDAAEAVRIIDDIGDGKRDQP